MRLRSSLLYTCALLSVSAGSALAQSTPPAPTGPVPPSPSTSQADGVTNATGPVRSNEVQEVVVTGSFVRGTPLTTALPVAVLSSEALSKQGSPSTLDLIKNLPISGPVLGDSNQFSTTAQGQVGTGTINLRGLGSLRTLVLLNGRRTVPSPGAGSGGVDTNLMPTAAINRVEILKDGAAATYGSDAIAGVVNFITRRNLEGFEVGGDYRYVDGSRGDWGGSLAFGKVFDQGNLLLTAGYQHRSELSTTKRGFANQPYLVNPSGYSVLGQPGSFLPLGATGAPVAGVQRDANCAAVGSYPGFTGTTPACYFSYVPFDNLIEEENRYQAYGEVNYKFNEHHRFHVEGLYAKTDIPTIRFSPSYPPTSGPNGPGSSGVFSTPVTNPGALTALQQAGLSPGVIAATNRISLTLFRPFGAGGNGVTSGFGGQSGYRKYDLYRVSAAFTGDLPGGLGYDVALTYSDETNKQLTTDILIDRLQRALNGFGGAGCTGATPGANGCFYYNPFSNAYPGNPALGLTNPGYVQANANDPNVSKFLFDTNNSNTQRQSLLVFDAILNGKVPAVRLPGGDIGFAVGFQTRRIKLDSSRESDFGDSRVTPCPQVGVTTCTVKTGPFIFLGQSVPIQLDQDVYALFGEASLPFTDKINGQLAVRYEDYGGLTGSTLNPKFALKWQIFDSFALRGSIGTSFRGPSPSDRSANSVTGLSGISAAGNGFKSVDFFGNPAIGPEKAFTFNVGGIFEQGGLRIIADYWNYTVDDQITFIPANIVATSVAGVGNGTQVVNCGAPLRNLITFSNNNACNPVGNPQGLTPTVGNDIARVRSDTVNGPSIKTSGIDASVDWRFNEVFGGKFTIGAAISYVLEYQQDAFNFNGVLVSPAYSAKGFANYDRLPGTISEWRGNFYADYSHDIHNLHATLNYVDGVTDNRAPIYVQTGPVAAPGCSAANVAPNCQLITFGQTVDPFYTIDLTYRVQLPWQTTISASVFNLLDRDPSQARLEYSYDPFIGNPYGRTFKVQFTKKF